MPGPPEADHQHPQGQRVVLTVGAAEHRLRADKAVAVLLRAGGHSVSRADVQRWMREGRVRSGEDLLTQAERVEQGSELVVVLGSALLSTATADPSVRFAVVHEDASLLVVDKPPGLVVHPARGHRQGTLVNGLLARGGFDLSLADPRDPEGKLRPGIVQRLDKETSGLLVVAKSAQAREALKAQLAQHDVDRQYLAIAVGRAAAAVYDTPHGRHPVHRVRFTSRRPRSARPGRAITRVEPLRALAGATLVRCTLQTGRTHQIRVHLAEQSGTPVLADRLYGRPVADPLLGRVADELGRHALHAAVLGFAHPLSGAWLRFESALPADMQRALLALTKPSS